MPELPEVETVRRGLEHLAAGQSIEFVTVTGRRSVRRQSAASFKKALTGRTMCAMLRHGKWLYCRLDDGAQLVIHLRMSGRLTVCDHDEETAAHTHVVIGLSSGKELRFIDPRTFGEMFVSVEVDDDGRPIELHARGIDPSLETLDANVLASLIANRHLGLKAFLLDQRAIAGIGSIYADEIAFRCGLRPDRSVDSLSRRDLQGLCTAISVVLSTAIELRGSSLRDESYRDLFGSLGSYQHHHAAYGRTGFGCPNCQTPIEKMIVAGRSAHFCPRCQR